MSEKQPTIPLDPIPETVAEALARWDRGESVFSVEMGGLGPSYEQAIQILAFELMRAFDGKLPRIEVEWTDENKATLKSLANEVETRLDGVYGFSGAQVGAARSLAVIVCRRGYRAALRMPEVKDRLILVSRNMPEAPKVGGAA